MFASTFTFAPGAFDENFHRLDQEIAAFAKSIPGYLGEESWENKTSVSALLTTSLRSAAI